MISIRIGTTMTIMVIGIFLVSIAISSIKCKQHLPVVVIEIRKAASFFVVFLLLIASGLLNCLWDC